MVPLVAKGNSISETWENALLELWENGIKIETQYDIDPNTGIKHPPSKDCMMMMIVEDALAEPRLHLSLEGGPAELAEYKLEVVNGVKDHWVKLSPEGTEWTYTYHGRLSSWGEKFNFMDRNEEFEIDNDNPWSQLAIYQSGIVDGKKKQSFKVLKPVDQIQYIIDTLIKAPFSRRGVALTGFPAGDINVEDPPCLRYVWCRGNYEKGYLSIDMHTHWRSRDAWGAALFNMYALTELQRYIVEKVQEGMQEKFNAYSDIKCPICGNKLEQDEGILQDYDYESHMYSCPKCYLRPYIVHAGRYIDVSDSFHIYGIDQNDFKNKFLNKIEEGEFSNRNWDLSQDMMQEIINEGYEKTYKLIESQDNKTGRNKINKTNKINQ